MKRKLRALGLMSGTSMDGVDAAVIVTDGERVLERSGGIGLSYAEGDRSLIEAAVAEARELADRDARPEALAAAEDMVTRLQARAVSLLLEKLSLAPGAIDIIGFHGQTILHRPQQGLTIQLGDGQLLADLTGIDVVYDMRAADMRAGGQGAPLASAYHRAMAKTSGFEPPVAFVNIGGVSNVTWIGKGRDILAFDTGPGNALIDEWVRRHTGAPMDEDGALAARGRVDETVLARLMESRFFDELPPKSLDKLDFTLEGFPEMRLEDGAATLTAFTAAAIAACQRHVAAEPKRWIVSGGGARNPSLMKALAERVGGEVLTADTAGWSSTYVEAEAFAFLAVRSLKGQPLTFPGTTGVTSPQTGGVHVSPQPGPELRSKAG
ncbi:MAG: anhydro-N-acetylmuramic acid kinase [Hyphomicrobiales bacterium]